MNDEVREHLTRDQRSFLHPESLQILQFNSSKCSPIMPDEVREHMTRDQRSFLHPESLQILQFNSSKCSPIMNDEVREHLTRDQRSFLHPESLQILQFNSSKCSPIMNDEVREHLTRDQRPFLHPESLQIHSSMTVFLLFSSPHSSSTGFRSEVRNGHSRSLLLCSVTHFCVVFEVCVWIIVRLEDPNMAHYKISN